MRSSPPPSSLRSRWISRTSTLVLALGVTGCLDRPIAPQEPTTTNVVVRTARHVELDKLDLLFMIDNSMSMADKQEILSQAVPVLLRRLVTPNCIDDQGRSVGVTDQNGRCAQGEPEMRSVKDIHIGVITSSLGAHGGTECSPLPDDAITGRTPDDRAELLPTTNPAVRGALPSWNGSGFLAWDPAQDRNVPPGEANLEALVRNFSNQVVGAGEYGCGYESSLEAWYRFLVDPDPPVDVKRVLYAGGAYIQSQGTVNRTILDQRKAFLRPDSLLAIVMLTDENDCSIIDADGSQGWLASTTMERLPRSTAVCATNPDDPCCHTCGGELQGCPPVAQDPECSKPGRLTLDEDQPNSRCFDQKRRFGMDLLYPVERYIEGLTAKRVRNRAGELVQNPIFAPANGLPERDAANVLLAGIVGVPWQDVSTPESWTGDGLTYLTAAELQKQGRWDVILGNAASPPTDPLMRESFAERAGTHPLLHVPMAPSSSPSRTANPINGREQAIAHGEDLQYACTFPLSTPRTCSAANEVSCDCNADEQANNRSLCEYPNGPGTDGMQVAGKAYPGVRTLEVLKGVGNNAIVASICPKHTEPAAGLSPEEDPAYGYNPAVQSVLELFRSRLHQQCLPRPLPVEQDGSVPCAVVEVVPRSAGGSCSCDPTRGRLEIETTDDKLTSGVRSQMRFDRRCGPDTGLDCNDVCMCKLAALEGDELAGCRAGSKDPDVFGYCYVDPAKNLGEEALVAECPESERRMLRYMGEGVPANGSVLFTACLGAAFTEN